MANSRGMIRAAPKRRIEKVYSLVNFSFDSTPSSVVVHTAEDAKTLVRAILRLEVMPEVNGDFTWATYFHKEPNATSVITAQTGNFPDIDMPQELIWCAQGTFENVNSINMTSRVLEVDLKGQRKLKVGDRLKIEAVGSIADPCASLAGTVTLIFKE